LLFLLHFPFAFFCFSVSSADRQFVAQIVDAWGEAGDGFGEAALMIVLDNATEDECASVGSHLNGVHRIEPS
jgi:hypothetical protein